MVAVRLTLLATAAIAAVAWFINPIATQGVLLGGLAGALGFWIIAIRLEKVARLKPEKVQFAALTWSVYRFALYGVVLYKTFTLDQETYYGLIGGLIGIMIIRFVLVVVGVTGLDKRLWKKASADDEDVEESEDKLDD
jgi:hypothetical protein